MALAHSAYRRIAGHLADVRSPERDEPNARTTSRCGGRRLATRVPRTNDKNVEHRWRLAKISESRNRLRRLFHVEHSFAEAKAPE
jgi:hypothetical protein